MTQNPLLLDLNRTLGELRKNKEFKMILYIGLGVVCFHRIFTSWNHSEMI